MSLDRLKQEQELCQYLEDKGCIFEISRFLKITDKKGNGMNKVYGDFMYGKDQHLWRANHYLGANIEQSVLRQLNDLECDLCILPGSILGCKGPDPEKTAIGLRLVRGMVEREFYNNQFKDITDGENYARKYNNALRRYVYSFPFRDIVHSSDWNFSGEYTKECSNQLFGIKWRDVSDSSYQFYEQLNSYSIREVKTILENYLNPYVIAMVLGVESSVEVKMINSLPYVTFKRVVNGKEEMFAISFNNKELFKLNGEKMRSLGNAHDCLFKELRLPITTVLNSAAEVFCPRLLPGEGQTLNIEDADLKRKLFNARSSDGYDDIYMQYVKVPYPVSEKRMY